MSDAPTPYVPAKPGDLITAENWNGMQVDVQQDIAKQLAAGIAGLKNIDHATDADKIGGMTVADLTKYILDRAFAQLPKRTGYMQILCNLEFTTAGVDKLIQHGLKAYPLVDLYELEYFLVVCAKDDAPADAQAEWVLFYLYHADERRLRIPNQTGAVDIETDPKFRILWKNLLDQFQEQKLLDYTDDTTLDDLEVDFWRALFKSPPNDEFDPDTYCHSPWFEKCCGEKRTVGDLKRHGDFDDIYLKMMPRKKTDVSLKIGGSTPPEPANVQVSQLDLDTIALRLLAAPTFIPTSPQGAPQNIVPVSNAQLQHLPLLALLKV